MIENINEYWLKEREYRLCKRSALKHLRKDWDLRELTS